MQPAPDQTFGIDWTIYPVSYRFWLITSHGQATQELTVDLPLHGANLDAAAALGPLLWTCSVATATSHFVECIGYDMMCWKQMIAPAFFPLQNMRGLAWSAPVARKDTGVLVLHTGHPDGDARRRLFLHDMPRDWGKDGLLTVEGAEKLQELARGMFVGMAEESPGSQITWLNAYPNHFEGGILPADKVAFRHVRWVRVCQYTERAPDRGSVAWP